MTAPADTTGWRPRLAGIGIVMLALLGLLSLFGLRAFAFQPFNIPAGSMMPTLMIGDYIAVSKYAYGFSRFSLPLSLPLWSGRVFASEPQRGDLVVFRLPRDTSTDYVKRVIGLPGERIQMIGGVLHINGEAVRRERLDDFVAASEGEAVRARRWREILPNGAAYEILDLQDNGFLDNTQVYVVPPRHYFMLGDNRDNSTDSRVLGQVGYVPGDNLVGRVEMVLFSMDGGSLRSDRIALRVR